MRRAAIVVVLVLAVIGDHAHADRDYVPSVAKVEADSDACHADLTEVVADEQGVDEDMRKELEVDRHQLADVCRQIDDDADIVTKSKDSLAECKPRAECDEAWKAFFQAETLVDSDGGPIVVLRNHARGLRATRGVHQATEPIEPALGASAPSPDDLKRDCELGNGAACTKASAALDDDDRVEWQTRACTKRGVADACFAMGDSARGAKLLDRACRSRKDAAACHRLATFYADSPRKAKAYEKLERRFADAVR